MISKQKILDYIMDMMGHSSFLTFPILKQLYDFIKDLEEEVE